jgi:hypothetical protein
MTARAVRVFSVIRTMAGSAHFAQQVERLGLAGGEMKNDHNSPGSRALEANWVPK